MVALPAFTIDWQITNLDVARSGDMAYTVYAYQMSFSSPSGAPVKDHGKDLVVWKKLADNKWKMQAEAFNSDLPAKLGKTGSVEAGQGTLCVSILRGDFWSPI